MPAACMTKNQIEMLLKSLMQFFILAKIYLSNVKNAAWPWQLLLMSIGSDYFFRKSMRDSRITQ